MNAEIYDQRIHDLVYTQENIDNEYIKKKIISLLIEMGDEFYNSRFYTLLGFTKSPTIEEVMNEYKNDLLKLEEHYQYYLQKLKDPYRIGSVVVNLNDKTFEFKGIILEIVKDKENYPAGAYSILTNTYKIQTWSIDDIYYLGFRLNLTDITNTLKKTTDQLLTDMNTYYTNATIGQVTADQPIREIEELENGRKRITFNSTSSYKVINSNMTITSNLTSVKNDIKKRIEEYEKEANIENVDENQ